jgi:hypothetical protein
MRRLIDLVGEHWPALAGYALALVLAHSGVGHLTPDGALRQHYREALGTADASYLIGVLQLAGAAALGFRGTRVAGALGVLAVVGAATLLRLVRTGSFEGLGPALVVVLVAVAVAVGEHGRRR